MMKVNVRVTIMATVTVSDDDIVTTTIIVTMKVNVLAKNDPGNGNDSVNDEINDGENANGHNKSPVWCNDQNWTGAKDICGI